MKSTHLRWLNLYRLLIPIFVLIVGGCIKIETAPEDNERKKEVSTNIGKDMRADWATRMHSATLGGKLLMTKTFMDSVASHYIKYGKTVAEQWRGINEMRGTDFPDVEMQKKVTEWNEPQQPMIQAYEDIVEYSYDEIGLASEVREDIKTILNDFRNRFYEIYSTVFFPNGGVTDYENKLNERQREFERVSLELGDLIEHYQ